jgi:uracil-DNA glycosylase
MSQEKENRLEKLRGICESCSNCPLRQGRTKMVFGEGDANAPVIFIGEAPGRDEDVSGRPFVGRSGKLLRAMIQAIGLSEKCFIANICKCLKYDSKVQLADGSWKKIGHIVRDKYSGLVRCIDHQGNIVFRKIIGWYKTPLNHRKLFNLTFKSAKKCGKSKTSTILTEDHLILTTKGYSPISKVSSGIKIATGQGFSKVVYDLLCGSLLGDGHINKKMALFNLNHSYKQKKYLSFKVRLLRKDFSCTMKERVVSAKNKKYKAIYCFTNSHRGLHILRDQFYSNGVKRVPGFLSTNLTPLMLAVWFMDDGHLRIRPSKQPLAEIATCAFSKKDLKILISGIKNLGIKSYILKNRIYFNVPQTKRLSEIIAPYVPSAMRRKLHPEIEKRVKFDKNLYKDENIINFFDTAEITPIREGKGNFYCIDVEEYHNFVTGGGVVHNCRPPNNRPPEEEEIATCVKFLNKQIEIIEPKLLILLGRTAVKGLIPDHKATPLDVLRRDSKNFSLIYNSIPVLVTYHPSALLRDPSRKIGSAEDFKFLQKKFS